MGRSRHAEQPAPVVWLLQGDPAVVWQAQRDLLRAPRAVWMPARERVVRDGWGARLLAERETGGTWGGGLYTPKWTSTFYTLQLLAQLGATENSADCVASCRLLLERGVRPDGSVVLWRSGGPDACVTAMLLGMASTIGLAGDARAKCMADWLLGEQMADGGWNCRRPRGATHASFHTTLSVLEAFHAWAGTGSGAHREALAAAQRGREFLLRNRLYRSHRTGKVVSAAFTRFSFPPRWKYDVLRALDHFCAVGADWDERLSDSLAVLLRRRGEDGRWRLQNRHPGRRWFDLEPVGRPSRMNTLRALRVLAWAGRVGGIRQ